MPPRPGTRGSTGSCTCPGWTGDPARCAAASIAPGRAFATKPALGLRMISPALDAGASAAWAAGAEATEATLGYEAAWRNGNSATPPGMIALTRNEIAHLAVALIQPARDVSHLLQQFADVAASRLAGADHPGRFLEFCR